jgi:hypothetical protein
MRRTFITACTAAVLTWTGVASAQRLDGPVTRDVYFTFSEPIVVPNRTLPAGKYLFRVIGDGRNIVQIYSGDRAKLIHTAMSVGTMRADQPERPEIRLIESSTTPAVGTWWYPEMRQGWEFIYPRAQAMTLAKTAKDSILTTAENVKPDDAGSAELVRLEPSGQQSAFAASGNRELTGAARVGEVAEADANANQVASAMSGQAGASAAARSATPAPVTQQAQSTTARTTLPRTASQRPFITLMGLLSLAAAGAIVLRRVA